jgi:hypothetical protein
MLRYFFCANGYILSQNRHFLQQKYFSSYVQQKKSGISPEKYGPQTKV